MTETSSSNNEANGYYPITIIKNNNSNSQLSLSPSQSQKSSSIKLGIRKDERLELLKINDFIIEKILEYGPSKIAEKLGIDN